MRIIILLTVTESSEQRDLKNHFVLLKTVPKNNVIKTLPLSNSYTSLSPEDGLNELVLKFFIHMDLPLDST